MFRLFILSVYLLPFATTCDEVVDEHLYYLLYTREHRLLPLTITDENADLIDLTKDNKLFIHGWLETGMDAYILNLKDAYLDKGDYNFITAVWSRYSSGSYDDATCNVPQAGARFADFLNRTDFDMARIHVIGFNLGAHVAGFLGQRIQEIRAGEKIARITGLDATAENYYVEYVDGRLSPDDAYFVDAIHTDGNGVGFNRFLGRIDFYPNGGDEQEGCSHLIPLCDHTRSIIYMTESINSDGFVGKRCFSYQDYVDGRCDEYEDIVMGENCPTNSTGDIFLTTNPTAPYAMGPKNPRFY